MDNKPEKIIPYQFEAKFCPLNKVIGKVTRKKKKKKRKSAILFVQTSLTHFLSLNK